MLTATYTLVSLSVEQASMRVSLLAFQKYMHVQLRHQRQLTLAQLQYAAEWLGSMAQNGYWRKVDQYLIPAVRQAAPQSGPLLEELHSLNGAAMASVTCVRQYAFAALDSSGQQADLLCAAIDSFCAALTARLEKEERELFALARKVIAGDAWFAIAHQLLAQDARARDGRKPAVGPAGADSSLVLLRPGLRHTVPSNDPRAERQPQPEKVIA